MIYLKYSTYILLVSAVCICHATREIEEVDVNPNCTDHPECDNANLVYMKSVGDENTIHYLWTTYGSVSMLMATTVKESVLILDWNKFFSPDNNYGAITFTPKANHTSVVVFSRLYEYDDKNNVVDVERVNDTHITTHLTCSSLFQWANVSVSGSHAQFQNLGDDVLRNKSLEFNLKAFVEEGNDDQLPSLKHSSGSFQWELVLNHFLTNGTYKNTRYAVELLIADDQVDDQDNTVHLSKDKSIDDEYTPGVFLTWTMKPSKSRGCYLQWKPVVYTSDERTTEYSTNAQQDLTSNFPTNPNRTEELGNSLAYAYYGEELWNLKTSGLNVSFGLEGDKYYQKRNYSTWTVVIGSGTPAEEKFSSTVITVIIVGFGVPAVAIIIGGTFIMVRSCKKKDELDPQLIKEEEEND